MKKILFTLTMTLLTITAQAQFKMGDVNRDGELNISDVTSVVNLLLYGYEPFSLSQTEVYMPIDSYRTVNLVENGDFEGFTNVNFYSMEGGNSAFRLLNINNRIGVDNSRAVMVETEDSMAHDWDAGFAIRFPTALPAGTKFNIEFDYKASAPASCPTQAHGEPGYYQHYVCLGNILFTTQWKHFESQVTVSNEMAGTNGMQSIVFNLAVNPESTQFFFDNIKVTIEKPSKNVITNSNMEGDDVSCFFSKDGSSTLIQPSVIHEGVGVNNSRAVMVSSKDNPSEEWDSQFFIRLPEALATGKWFHIEFDYKASAGCNISTQAHGEPGYYQYWSGIGSINFTTQWQHFKKDVFVTSEMASSNGMQSICFLLAKNQTATQFYFDNIKVQVERREGEPAGVPETVDIIGGYDEYYVMTDDHEVVVPSLDGHTVKLTPVGEGIATVTVVDIPTYRAIEITVMVEDNE